MENQRKKWFKGEVISLFARGSCWFNPGAGGVYRTWFFRSPNASFLLVLSWASPPIQGHGGQGDDIAQSSACTTA